MRNAKLNHPVTQRHANCGNVRITCGLKVYLLSDFREQLNNAYRWDFHIPPNKSSDPWIAAGVPRAILQYLALRNTMQIPFHWPRKRWLFPALLDTFYQSVRTGYGVNPSPSRQHSLTVTLGSKAPEGKLQMKALMMKSSHKNGNSKNTKSSSSTY